MFFIQICFLKLLLLLSSNLLSIDLLLPQSASHNASNNLMSLSNSASNGFLSPAFSGKGAELSYSKLYNLTEIDFGSTSVIYQIQNYCAFLGVSQIRHKYYKESIYRLNFNYKYRSISVGIGNNLLTSKIDGSVTESTYILDLGINLYQNWYNQHIVFKDVFSSEIYGLKLNRKYLWETGIFLGKDSIMSVGFEKEETYDFIFKMGFSHKLFENLKIITSYQYKPDRLAAGVVFTIQNYSMIYSINYHSYLDSTNFISLGYSFEN